MKEIEVLNIEKKTLQAECAQNLASCNNFRSTWIECKKIEILQMKGSDDEWVSALKAKGFPSVQKETNGPALTEMVSKALFAIMAVTMAYTKPINWLRVIAQVLFQNFLLGVDAKSSIFTSLVRKFV